MPRCYPSEGLPVTTLPPRQPPRLTPPRWLAAASMTLGVAYFTLFLTSPAAEAADPRPVTVLIPFALMHIG